MRLSDGDDDIWDCDDLWNGALVGIGPGGPIINKNFISSGGGGQILIF